MIDCEIKVFNFVHPAVSKLCAKNRFLSTQIISYTDLPAASLFELDNRTVQYRQTTALDEEYSWVTYQLDVVAKTKDKCRKIFMAADEKMLQLNFRRVSATYITYPDNTEIVRYVARYEAVVDKSGNLYRAR